jgi:hypothetical protein
MAPPGTVVLYRPVGTVELGLIEATGWLAFPPRLPEQPIFYPVTTQAYAVKIARDWNTKFDDKRGYVTRFCVNQAFLRRYRAELAGGQAHEEYWIPADDLAELNASIVGVIEVVEKYTEADRLAFESAGDTNQQLKTAKHGG